MTLTTRTEMRRCGRLWPTENNARTSKKGLTGDYSPVPCVHGYDGWHLVSLAARQEILRKQQEQSRKAPRDTGFSRKVRATALERDGHACVCCGLTVIGQRYALQHRNARGMGGTSDPLSGSPANALTMLEACHLRVESRIDPHDNAKGYWLRMGESPLLTPVMYFSPGGSGFTAWLGEDGSLNFDGPVGAEAVA